jgi:hypothetical protein
MYSLHAAPTRNYHRHVLHCVQYIGLDFRNISLFSSNSMAPPPQPAYSISNALYYQTRPCGCVCVCVCVSARSILRPQCIEITALCSQLNCAAPPHPHSTTICVHYTSFFAAPLWKTVREAGVLSRKMLLSRADDDEVGRPGQ